MYVVSIPSDAPIIFPESYTLWCAFFPNGETRVPFVQAILSNDSLWILGLYFAGSPFFVAFRILDQNF